MSNDSLILIKKQLSQLFGQVISKVSFKQVEEHNNNFTGINNFNFNPTVSINGIKRSLLTNLDVNSNIKSNFTSIISNKKLLIDNTILNYIVKIVQYNIILDFINFSIVSNTSYEFSFTITGLFFVDSIINLNGISYSVININSGNGTNLIKQIINIDVDSNGYPIIYSRSYSYTKGIQQTNNLTISSDADSLINIESTNDSINLFNFSNYSESDNNSLSQGLCSKNGKLLDQTSNSLLIKCNVNSKVAGININDSYYIPMYKAEYI